MSRQNKFTQDSKLVAVRLPKSLRERAALYCEQEDLTISQLLRRAVKREISTPMKTVTENNEVVA